MARPTLASGIAAFFVESLLFGAFTVTYGICTWILLFRDRRVGDLARNIVLFFASTVIYVLALVVSSIRLTYGSWHVDGLVTSTPLSMCMYSLTPL